MQELKYRSSEGPLSPSMTFPVLCHYLLHDGLDTDGWIMIQVSRLEDIRAEFKVQMPIRAKDGFFGRDKVLPKRIELLEYRTRDFVARESFAG